MAKLYPPVIEGTIPAFNGAVITVPFSMNRSVAVSQISGFALKIKTIQSNTYIATLTNGRLNDDGTAAIFYLSTNEEGKLSWLDTLEEDPDRYLLTPGQSYKAQLAYICEGEEGYYSTVGVIKYANIAQDAVQLLAGTTNILDNQNTLSSFKHTYSGVYDYTNDPMEKVYTYRFVLYDEVGNILEDSGELLHNATQDTLHTSVDTYTFLDDIEKNTTCYLQYTLTTVNGLVLSTPRVGIIAADEWVVPLNLKINARNHYDNGYIQIDFIGSLEDTISGKFRIYRQDVQYPKRWEPVYSFIVQGMAASHMDAWKDFTIEHGKTYKYKLCQFNDADIIAPIAYSNEVYADFEDMFLFDGERQLKIQYNPKVSSFKNDILESKLDTIGSKYPFFFRNGVVKYKEFPISGLISYLADEEELFKSLTELGLSDINKRIDRLTTVSPVTWRTPMEVFTWYEDIPEEEEPEEPIGDDEPISDSDGITPTDNEPSNMGDGGETNPDDTGEDGGEEETPTFETRTLNMSQQLFYNYDDNMTYVRSHTPGYKITIYGDKEHSKENTKTLTIPAVTDIQTAASIDTIDDERWGIIKDAMQNAIRQALTALIIPSSRRLNPDSALSEEKLLTPNVKTTNLVNYNIAAERQFKLDVLEWLTNGKPKLFRSPTEGNYIVRLLNTSLTPIDSLGRMLHSFNTTAYEMDDANYHNLTSYGFIIGAELANDIRQLRFRTIHWKEWKDKVFYQPDRDGFVELLIDPYNNHGALTAQAILIENCSYPSKFYINGVPITIGMTQRYNIDNLFEIRSIKFRPAEVSNCDDVYITYSYYDTFKNVTVFDNITDIEVGNVPIQQFIGSEVGGEAHNIINDITNNKRNVSSYSQIIFEKRPIEDIYTMIDIRKDSRAANIASYFDSGFDEGWTNRIFSFDKTGWGRGRETVNGYQVFRNYVNGEQKPMDMIKNMPFYIFRVRPMTMVSEYVASQLRIYRGQLLQIAAREQKANTIIPYAYDADHSVDDIIAYLNLTNKNDEQSRNEKAMIRNLKELLINHPITIGTIIDEQTEGYSLTQDTERVPGKTYYIKRQAGNEITYVPYFDALPNSETNTTVYEYGAIRSVMSNLYASIDTDNWYSDEEYYMCYDYNNNVFKFFDDNNYSAKVYMNTGHIQGITFDDPALEQYCIDLTDAIQPVVYYDLEPISDLYIGNGVIATLGYSYLTTFYSFEEQGVLNALKRLYDESWAQYQQLVQSYDDESLQTPHASRQQVPQELLNRYEDTSGDPKPTTWGPWLNYLDKKYVELFEIQFRLWKEANGIND